MRDRDLETDETRRLWNDGGVIPPSAPLELTRRARRRMARHWRRELGGRPRRVHRYADAFVYGAAVAVGFLVTLVVVGGGILAVTWHALSIAS